MGEERAVLRPSLTWRLELQCESWKALILIPEETVTRGGGEVAGEPSPCAHVQSWDEEL